jgi:uncharacterized protein with HEPN domain
MNAARPTVEWLTDARHYASEARRLVGTAQSPPSDDDTLAIRYCLLVVGEALDWVPGGILSQEANIPWRKVIALRHRLVHGYWLVDEGILVQIARNDIEPLIDALDRLIIKAT